MRSSSGLSRKTALKPGSGFKRKTIERRPPAPPSRATRLASYGGETTGKPVEKENPVVCEEYRRLVRMLPCHRCRIEGYTQFCHTDLGKGRSIKTDDRLGWPGCGPHPGPDGNLVPGCHEEVGRDLLREERRAFEEEASRATREVVTTAGLWPKKLEPWPGDWPAA